MNYENSSWYYILNGVYYHCTVNGNYFINDYGEIYKAYIYKN